MIATLKCDPRKLPAPPKYATISNRQAVPVIKKPKTPKPRKEDKRSSVQRGYTPAQQQVIYTMRKQGFSYIAIGKEIGKSPNAVRKFAIKRWGKEVEVDRYQNGKGQHGDQGDKRDGVGAGS
jgi:hypothetical protein